MKANKQSLNRTGQTGLVILVGSMTLATFSAGPAGLIEIFCGVLGFYLITNQNAFRRTPKGVRSYSDLKSKKEVKKAGGVT